MLKSTFLITLILSFLAIIQLSAAEAALSKSNGKEADFSLLSKFSPHWIVNAIVPANSEQKQPLFLGLTPHELSLDLEATLNPTIPMRYLQIGFEQAMEIKGLLGKGDIELETWPSETDGLPTWVFARWRKASSDPWQWIELDKSAIKKMAKKHDEVESAMPILPQSLNLGDENHLSKLFTDFMKLDDLYEKPLFGDSIWVSNNGKKIFAAWPDLHESSAFLKEIKTNNKIIGEIRVLILPQPARLNANAITFVINVSNSDVVFPGHIDWEMPLPEMSTPKIKTSLLTSVEDDDKDNFIDDIKFLTTQFPNRNNADKNNQLEELNDYLTKKYLTLGYKSENIIRQRFEWRGMTQSNLVVKIQGSIRKSQNKPILIADHIDAAFAEDIFNKEKKRVSAPGADDNAAASAALLLAGKMLRTIKPAHDIWLVHLTGEEFPADDLGARVLMHELRKQKQEISGVILLDMIGFRKKSDPIFQINPAADHDSVRIATLAKAIAMKIAPQLKAEVKPRNDLSSYLYNTDGLIIEQEGYPVVLFNEHMNRYLLSRKGYHDMRDVPEKLDYDYALAIVKTAIETAATLAKP